jgi:uncharacterized protein YyaL (SSP411 family)
MAAQHGGGAPDGDAAAPRFTNRLSGEKSPYLLQHAHNPVDWFPWGDEALAKARAEDKPIFLSVGYSACHWCHVMERESFEDEETARLLNERFVSVKVDREERPDIDEVYMTAVQMMTRHGGWPMSVFLLPDGRPFYGGTYFPPENRHGRIGFKSLVTQLADAYHSRRAEVEQVAQGVAEDLVQAARQRPIEAETAHLHPAALLAGSVADLDERFDAQNGGFGDAPKFPPHHALRLLLTALRRGDTAHAPRLLFTTLDKMALGGVYDHVGGGFHRYATDAVWLLPHFEKMLYDNALLARVYAEAYAVTGRDAYGRVARETCDWVLRDLLDDGGAFHAALDADSEGEEGKYYVWTQAEVTDALGGDEAAAAALCRAYLILPGGNYRDEATGKRTGANIPHLSAGNVPEGVTLPDTLTPELAEARAKILAARYHRVPPGKDDKVITSWNGLMIGGLAYAGKALAEPRYLDAARRAATFCLTTLRPDGELLRRYAKREAGLPAFLDDYAFLADGLLDLHDAIGEPEWADAARTLADTLLERFWDHEDGGFFYSGTGHETLIAPTKDLFDGALPSANGVAVRVLARLGGDYAEKARQTLRSFHGYLQRAPQGTQTLILAALEAFAGHEDPPEMLTHDQAVAAMASPKLAVLAADGPAPLTLAPGQSVVATFTLQIADGYHVNARQPGPDYLLPTVANLTTDAPAAVGPVGYPAPAPWDAAGTRVAVYQGAARFEVPVTLPADAPEGAYELRLTVRYQACSESECLPPEEQTATLALEVLTAAAAP